MPWLHPDYIDEHTLRTSLPLGENPKTGDLFLVPDVDRYAGTHVIGVQGYGKSRLLESLIHHDISIGNAVIVIDPHGDLADHCLNALPENALGKTSLLDLSDETHPFHANPFAQGKLASSAAFDAAVERVTHLFEVFWPEVMAQQYAPQYLRNASRVLLCNPGATLYDLKRFLRAKAYRAQLLQAVREPQVVSFWREYDQLKPDTQESRSRPLLNRWHQLMSSPLLRNIICQPEGIDFRKAIEQKQVLFIKLPTTTLATTAGMVGTILLGQITAALFSFNDVPDSQRPGFSLYMDEFQNFAEGQDIQRLFSEGRKFGVRLTIANQRLDQLPASVQAAVESARTKIVFRVTPSDSKKLAQTFPTHAARPKPEDIHPYPCEYLMSHTQTLTDPDVIQFIEYYLLPLQGHRGSKGSVGIRDAAWIGDVLSHKDKPVFVPDPTPHLDVLLREVMAFDNPLLPIPVEVVRGLSNAGHGFFPAVRWIMPDDPILCAPTRWESERLPESPKEWLRHCVGLLRATMTYLAKHPLGNVKETGTGEIAQKLAMLPRRIAFVRSGDDFGPIKTFDAPELFTGDDLEMRRYLVAMQSERYCRPRAEVEARFTQDNAQDDGQDADVPEPGPAPAPAHAPAPAPALEPERPWQPPAAPAVSRWEL